MPEYEDTHTPPTDPAAFIHRTYGRADTPGRGDAHHPPASPHLLIRASAGTGKTYRLTTRYLRLLRAGETAEHILATTFTRKAAGEVLQRVLGWLARAAVDADERAALDHALGGFGLTRAECLAMLRRLVEGLHRLSIGTIDSFFNRAARALRFELDLPAEPRLTDEAGPLARAMRYDAIQQTLGQAIDSDHGMQTLVELLRRVHHDTANRSVTQAIDTLVVGLHDVYRQHPDRALWTKLNPPAPLGPELLTPAVEAVLTLGESIPRTNGGTPRVAWVKAYEHLCESAQRGDFDAFMGHTMCRHLIDEEEPDRFSGVDIPDPWRDALMPLIAHARALALQQLAHQTEATYDLLHAFATHYEDAKRAAGVLLFSDLTHRLASYLPSLGDDAATEFYYRLDARVTHLLLDEFQDTSPPQWKVLEPFAEEVTAVADGARSFFCVGDEKQAIYGWRGGCAELFTEVERLPGVSPWTMTLSRRSSPVVLDAVNRVFSTLTGNVALKDLDKDGKGKGKDGAGRWDEAVSAWSSRFEEHVAHDASLPGHVLLKTTAPKADGEPEDEEDDAGDEGAYGRGPASPHELYCADHIAALAEAHPGRSVGVLVRRKKSVPGLLHRLRALGVDVSEEGGQRIDHTPAVSAVLAAVRLADYPGDRVAAFHVANSPLGEVVGLVGTSPAKAGPVAARLRRALLDRGFGEVVAGWCRALAPSCDARSLRRMEQLVALAQRYDQNLALDIGPMPGGRPHGFVEVVRQARIAAPTPAAVRVMTLHAAKGLEFDCVVLPDLHATLSRNDHKALVMLDRDSPVDEPRAVVRRMKREKLAALGLEGLADRGDALQRGEDLCLLYVGMTRAKHALHLLVPPLVERKKNGAGTGEPTSDGLTSLSYAAVLRQALAPGVVEHFDGGEVLHASGGAAWSGRAARTSDPAEDTRVNATPLSIKLAPARHPLRSRPERRPSDGGEDATVHAADLLGMSESAGRSFGSAMHAVCERVGFVDEDAPPGDGTIAEALRSVGMAPSAADVARYAGALSAMLGGGAVREALSRGGAAELWRERGFAALIDGRLIRGVFDRVHVWRDEEGNATRARLIDFKTDRPGKGGVAALADRYRAQVDAYRAALSAMLKLDAQQIEAVLVLVGEAAVVRVEGE